MQSDVDFSLAAVGKRILQGVRYQLVDDQPAGDRRIQVQCNGVEFGAEMNAPPGGAIRPEQMSGELAYVLRKIDLRKILRLIQALVQTRHGVNPVLTLLEHF